jgi:hypothetical protein
MAVLEVDLVGIRTERLYWTVSLIRDCPCVPVARQTEDLVGSMLADGTAVELYSPSNEFHTFFATGPVVALRVDDFDATRRAGVDFIGEAQPANDVTWQYFRCPDGKILEISGPGGDTVGL